MRLPKLWATSVFALLLAGCGREADAPEPGSPADEAYRALFEHHYYAGVRATDAGFGPARAASSRFRWSAQRSRAIADHFLAEYRPLETATRGDIPELVRSGMAVSTIRREIEASAMDPDDVLDVAVFHLAVHWAVANRSRAPEAEFPRLRQRLRHRVQAEVAAAGDDGALQEIADTYALLAAIRSNEYAMLVRSGASADAERYSDAVARDYAHRHGVRLRDSEIFAASR